MPSGRAQRTPVRRIALGLPQCISHAVAIAASSPGFHRRQRRTRQRVRRAIWKQRRLGLALGEELAWRATHLAQHHSRPCYRELMAKYKQKWWPNEWVERAPLPRRKNNEPQNKKGKENEMVATGFDGRTVKVAKEDRVATGGGSSSSSASNKELADLKEMMRKLMNGESNAFTEGQLRLLESSPRDSMREKQRELNRQRKHYNKEKNLQQKIQANEEKWETWMHMQRTIIRQEKERYELEQSRLKKELVKLQCSQEDMDEEESTLPELDDLIPGPQPPPAPDMSQRVLNAERAAAEAQQAFAMVQQQMHQLVYMQHASVQALQQHGMTFEMEHQGNGPPAPSPTPNAGSPQLPKGVRNGTLKAKNGERPKGPKAPKDSKDKEDTEVVDIEAEVTGTAGL